MKPAPFDYLAATSLEQAITALADAAGDGKIIAGGQSLTPLLALRLVRPSVLIDINPVPGLAGIETTAQRGLRFGALTRHRALAEQRGYPLLAEAARWIGHPAIRTRGTIGGSLAHADPAAEFPVVAVAADATVHVAGPAGYRTVPAEEFFTGPFQTCLADEEIIAAVEFPPLAGWGFAEFARRHGDFGLVTVAVAEVAGRVRIAVGGVAGTPFRPTGAEESLAGAVPDAAHIEDAAQAAAAAVHPANDVHASAGYRRNLTRVLVARALASAVGPAIGAV